MQVRKQQLEQDTKQQTGSKSGKADTCQGCVLSPCLFNLYAEYIMRNTGLDDTTFMVESEKELMSVLMKVKGE